jgi:hypothetical protein
MSPDFRYHVATLAAVFLALGIGILIGTAFVGAPIVQRQTGLIGRLEKNVADLRRETAETDRSEEVLRALLPGTVRGKLAGQRVLVVQAGAYADAAAQAEEALQLAGAEVIRISLPEAAWRLPAASSTDTQVDEAISEEARRLAPAIAAGGGSTFDTYRERGLVSGDDITTGMGGAIRYLVLVGGGQAAPEKMSEKVSGMATPAPEVPWPTTLARARDIPLAEELTILGVTVVGVEPVGAGISYMPIYQDAGIGTVDCVDRAAGKIALPFALRGEKARYGMKPTADRIVPPSLAELSEASEGTSGVARPAPSPSPSPLASPQPPLLRPTPTARPTPS